MPISQAVMDEIKRKALAGEKMATPTAEKTKIFNSFLSQNNPASAVTRTTTTKRTTTNNAANTASNSPVNTTARNTITNQTPQQDPNAIDTQAIYRQVLERLNQPQAQFSYNPNTDPQYQAALQQAQQNATLGNNANMAEMNRRGILNSTITSDRGAEIQQNALGRVTSEVLPQLMAQSYQRFIDQQNAGQQQLQNQFSLLDRVTRDRDTANQLELQRGQLTGRLISDQDRAALPLLNQLTSLGQAWQQSTPEQRTAISQQANSIRDQLAQMGVDPSLFDPNLSTEQRRTSTQRIGTPTLSAQNQAFNQNMETQQFDFQKAQQEWENNFNKEQFDWQKAQQIYENTFKERSFEQDIKEAAASRGLQWAQLSQRDKEFLADQEWREKNFELEKQREERLADTPKPSKNEIEADYISKIDRIPPENLEAFFKNEKAQIIRDLGMGGYNSLKQQYGIVE